MIEIDSRKLPIVVKVKGKGGACVLYILKAGKKLGAQLIAPDRGTLQLLTQN